MFLKIPSVLNFLSLGTLMLALAGCAGTPSGSGSSPESSPEPRTASRPQMSSPEPARPVPSKREPVREPVPAPAPAVKPSPPAIGVVQPPEPQPSPPRPVPTAQKPSRPVPTRTQKQASAPNELDVLLGGSPQIAARESDSGTSIRGFSPLSREYGQKKGLAQPILDAVRDMENFRVTPGEIQQFQVEGGLSGRPR